LCGRDVVGGAAIATGIAGSGEYGLDLRERPRYTIVITVEIGLEA
jgi:hypothetical protein